MKVFKISSSKDYLDHARLAAFRGRDGNVFMISVHPELLSELEATRLVINFDQEIGQVLENAAQNYMLGKAKELQRFEATST